MTDDIHPYKHGEINWKLIATIPAVVGDKQPPDILVWTHQDGYPHAVVAEWLGSWWEVHAEERLDLSKATHWADIQPPIIWVETDNGYLKPSDEL